MTSPNVWPAPIYIFELIERDSFDELRALLDVDPVSIYRRHPDPQLHHWTTLQYAAARGKLRICKLLIDRGAEVYTNPMNTYPPVIQAAWNKRLEVVDYFLNVIPHLAEGTNGVGVAINLAAREGWSDLVARHIALDPLSVHQRGWIGDTPLHWPAHNGHSQTLTMLLDAGAVIEADEINCYGGKPLHWASEHAPKSVAILIMRGANVNSRNMLTKSSNFLFTPLIMNASQKDDCSAVTEILLGAGADPTLKDAHGKTALDHAVEGGRTNIERVLRDAGA